MSAALLRTVSGAAATVVDPWDSRGRHTTGGLHRTSRGSDLARLSPALKYVPDILSDAAILTEAVTATAGSSSCPSCPAAADDAGAGGEGHGAVAGLWHDARAGAQLTHPLHETLSVALPDNIPAMLSTALHHDTVTKSAGYHTAASHPLGPDQPSTARHSDVSELAYKGGCSPRPLRTGIGHRGWPPRPRRLSQRQSQLLLRYHQLGVGVQPRAAAPKDSGAVASRADESRASLLHSGVPAVPILVEADGVAAAVAAAGAGVHAGTKIAGAACGACAGAVCAGKERALCIESEADTAVVPLEVWRHHDEDCPHLPRVDQLVPQPGGTR